MARSRGLLPPLCPEVRAPSQGPWAMVPQENQVPRMTKQLPSDRSGLQASIERRLLMAADVGDGGVACQCRRRPEGVQQKLDLKRLSDNFARRQKEAE